MSADIDIDFADRKLILDLIKHIPARQQDRKHNSGVYVTDIPVDPLNGCSSLDYNEGDKRGYFKIDFLNVSVYSKIRDKDHYKTLLEKEPSWDKLLDKNFCSKIVHISNNYNDIVKMKPDSITRMAMFLAAIRPAKRHLLGKNWKDISTEIWKKPSDNEYYFKKAHAISYAKLVSLHMNIEEELIN